MTSGVPLPLAYVAMAASLFCGWALGRHVWPASAIEARSGETTKIGSTEGESATAKPDAQKGSSNGI